MSIEQRLSRLESKAPPDDAHIWYCATDEVAAAAHCQARAEGKTPGLYFVTHNPAQEPAMIDAGSFKEEYERIQRLGRKIHDKRDPNEPSRPESKTTLWQPPFNERR